jgi:MFS family permease
VGHGGGFWVVAAALAVSVAFSTLPTPLYGLYEQRDGFGPPTITVVFVAYALGVIASLYLVGHISDWVGRRRMIIAATLTEHRATRRRLVGQLCARSADHAVSAVPCAAAAQCGGRRAGAGNRGAP